MEKLTNVLDGLMKKVPSKEPESPDKLKPKEETKEQPGRQIPLAPEKLPLKERRKLFNEN